MAVDRALDTCLAALLSAAAESGEIRNDITPRLVSRLFVRHDQLDP